MITALLPVKAFDRSKERLAGFLTPAERQQLALTMFEDVWATLEECRLGDRAVEQLLVISAEQQVISRCRECGVPCMEEEEQVSHSASVSRGTEWAIQMGATSLISVAIDTPSVTPAEIRAMLQVRDAFSVIVAPSADGLGTNALLRTPPDAIEPCFGPGSCRLHVQQAQKRDLPVLVYPSLGFAADIDTPEDLRVFSQLETPCRTRDLVRQFLAVSRGASACR